MDSEPERTPTSSLTLDIPATKPVRIPLRFAIGDMRFLTLGINAREVLGHFLEQPRTVSHLIQAHKAAGGAQSTFGRSIILGAENGAPTSQPHAKLRILNEYNRHYVTIQGTFADYLAKFSSRSRSTLLRKVRKFETASHGSTDWATFRTPTEVEPFLNEALPLSRDTYQHRLLGSGLPETEDFRRHLQNLAVENKFRGWLLRLDGRPTAYICSEAVGATLLYEYVGFDPKRSDLSPGTVLQVLVLEQLFSEQTFRHFDFTEGEGSHKEFFGTDSHRCGDVLIIGESLSSDLLLLSHRAFNRVAAAIVSAANRFGLKAAVRRVLRRGL